jgi:alpha-tubulin suppressor-like RCC1 family protein
VIEISTGRSHLLILTKENKVFSMGKGIGGALGHGDELQLDKPKQLAMLAISKVIKIVAAGDQSGCLTDKKQLLFWGNNGYDPPQLKPRLHPKSLVRDEKEKVKDVKLGESHTIILTESNNVMTWGRNEKGCLGRCNVENGWFERDAEESILSKMEGIAAGKFSSVAWGKKKFTQFLK